MASYEGFYEGSSSSLNSEFGNLTGYHMSAAMIGFPGSPQSADQLHDTVNAIKHGTKVFEITMLKADVGDTIPRQHFDEMKALMKLTGVKPSVHAPLLDPAGFDDRGYSSAAREDNERRLFTAIERAQVMNSDGNMPFDMHASNGAPGTEWVPGDEKTGEGEGDVKFVMESSTMINKETGQTQQVKRDYQFRPGSDPTKSYDEKHKEVKGGELGILFSAEGSISSANNSDWKNRMTEVAQMSKHAEEIIGAAPIHLGEYENAFITKDGGEIVGIGEDGKSLKLMSNFDVQSEQAGAYNQIKKAGVFLHNAELSFGSAFHHAYKYGTPEQKEKLEDFSKEYEKKEEKIQRSSAIHLGGDKVAVDIWNPLKRKEFLDESLLKLQEITKEKSPKVFELTEKFAMGEAAKTFGNLASKAYDKFGEKAPVFAIENVWVGMAFSRAQDMRNLIKKSRSNFVEHLREGGMGEKKAEKLAEDKVGVTWDVGHINIMRKKGFTEADVVAETKLMVKDKSMVKHLHLTDNFGYSDSHLLPGMGNVPIKGIMEELEKTGRLGEMKQIVEAGGIVQHFKTLPHSMALAAFGSGIYGMKNGPTWGHAMNIQGANSGGYGSLNPSIHHQYFGAGFTTMPVELGGQMEGGGSRFGGTPMA